MQIQADQLDLNLYRVKTILNNDEIKGLPTAGLDSPIVAPALAGEIPLFIKGRLHLYNAGGVYGNLHATSMLQIVHRIDVDTPVSIKVLNNGFLDLAGPRFEDLVPFVQANTDDGRIFGSRGSIADIIDQPLQLMCANFSGNLTGGHADNTLEVILTYGY